MLLDSFSLSPSVKNLYYLPEQSLDTYDGLNAQGTWTLEIQDDRVGATNPLPELLSWQLRFNYVTFGTNANGIPPGTTATNVIPAGGWAYYLINVPTNADVATNILVFATGPLDIWFNSATPPPPGNNLLLSGVINGTSVLSTFSVPTNIVPGGIYYIGLQNPNAFPVTNGFQVNFHYFQTTPVTPGVPVTNTVAGAISGDGVDYYSVKVPPDADYATNLLLSSTVPVNMWFNQTKPPVCLTPPDYLLIANATQRNQCPEHELGAAAAARLDLLFGCPKHECRQCHLRAGGEFPPYRLFPDQRRAHHEFRSDEQLCLLFGDGADECRLRHQSAALCQPAGQCLV